MLVGICIVVEFNFHATHRGGTKEQETLKRNEELWKEQFILHRTSSAIHCRSLRDEVKKILWIDSTSPLENLNADRAVIGSHDGRFNRSFFYLVFQYA